MCGSASSFESKFLTHSKNKKKFVWNLQKAHQFNLSKSYEIGHFREISYEWNPPECEEGNLTTEYPIVSFIIVFHNEARSALLRTICMGYINFRRFYFTLGSIEFGFRAIYSIKVSILETVPNWIVGEIILIDDASDDKNMLLELDQIDVSEGVG